MCEVGEDYREPAPAGPPPPRPSREQKCVKCKEGLPVVVIRAGDAFCRDCFKAFYVHKFRAVLGKNRLVFPGEKVLLAWSGGPSSSSMLWQVLEGLSRDSAKRLRFVPGVVYADEGAACGQSPEDRAKTLAEAKLVLQTVGFPWHIVALEEVFSLPPSVLRCSAREPVGTEGAYKAAVDSFLQQRHALGEQSQPCPQHPQSQVGPPPANQTEALSRLFNSVKTLTAKEELLQTLRTHLILHVARTHGYSKVMTGDSCTRLAIKLMTSLALGRGAFLAWDTGFSDERHGDVVVVRPMREHTLKEVAFYNRLFAVPSVFTPAVDTKAPEKASIHRLMEAFILRLQAQFPSTVSTVYRTSEKLVKAPRDGCAAGTPGPRCLLCMCVLDVDTADSATAFGAQTFSQLPQTQPPVAQAEAPTVSSCCSGMGGARRCCRPEEEEEEEEEEDPRAHVTEQLCYGCRVNMKDLPSLDPLPPYILAEAQLRSPRAKAEQQIQEYLLEDHEDAARPGES
ncbi:cytoplasmic tRNA 2-thiolation protein 2 isoform X2 [Physeter macrocephalus]|uniref:Cytoplasmic tRNA 2-thiolation protein 2 n=1 Tax=Physeter macrocephalus TaxID=9755 RepID=A0A2Y9SQL0_PHYMC|nr:cytoplasmic tRNA 2-thiolation protein 2 isoform X2 [Physeter catodon]|eukprot:XP_023980568.1 cytoplasmic tRNA 2-thiolation protein 2 isoform X1 [Physeter catodon]